MKEYLYMNRALERTCPWLFTKDLYDEQGDQVPKDREVGLAEAQVHWESVLKDQVPGFAISPYPQVFMIQIPRFFAEEGKESGWMPVYLVDTEAIHWGWSRNLDISGEIVCYSKFDTTPLKEWSYMAAAEKCGAAISPPDPKDLPNPRVYWLDGTLAIGWNENKPIGPWLMFLFQDHVRCIWSDGRNINHRNDRLTKFLDHHRDKGGDRKKFVAHVGDLISAPPKGFDGLLVAKLKAWKSEQRAGDHSVPIAKVEQHVIARVHAYRFLTREKDADISTQNDVAIAASHGWTAPSSGRALRNLYNRYTQRKNAMAERIGHPSHPQAKHHLAKTLKLLKGHPEALAMAEKEFKELLGKLGEDAG